MASNSQIPFTPLGNTVRFTAATSAPSAVQAVVDPGQVSYGQYRIVNAGTVAVFLGYGATSAQASSRAVTTAPSKALKILPNSDLILRFGVDFYFTGVTASDTAVVDITPGVGL